jgi:hypothetical protein
VVCRDCGQGLPPAFAGRPRAYCSVTCRQRAYRRRKAAAATAQAAAEATETTEARTEATEPAGDRGPASLGGARPGRPGSAEAILIRVRLNGGGCDGVESAAGDGWGVLDDLARAALLLVQRWMARVRVETAEPERREPGTESVAHDDAAAEESAEDEAIAGLPGAGTVSRRALLTTCRTTRVPANSGPGPPLPK